MQQWLDPQPALRKVTRTLLVFAVMLLMACGDDKPKRPGSTSSNTSNKSSGDGTKPPGKGPNVDEIINGSQILILDDVVFKSGGTDPLTGTVVWMHGNGKRAEEVRCVSGRWHGPALWWYEDGTKAGEGTYNDGDWDGEYKEWYGNGKMKIQLTFKEGREQGKEVWYYESGQVMTVTPYEDGNKTGQALGYFENGVKQWQAQWANNVAVGEYWEAYETGEKKSVKRYNQQGQEDGLEEYWHLKRGDNQPLSQEIPWAAGKLHGIKKEWYPNGQPMNWITYERGVQHGSAGSFYENGAKATQGTFENGVAKGVQRWDINGKPEGAPAAAPPRARTNRWDTGQLVEYYKGKPEGEIQSDFGTADGTAAGGAWVYRGINFINPQTKQPFLATVQFAFQAGKVSDVKVITN